MIGPMSRICNLVEDVLIDGRDWEGVCVNGVCSPMVENNEPKSIRGLVVEPRRDKSCPKSIMGFGFVAEVDGYILVVVNIGLDLVCDTEEPRHNDPEQRPPNKLRSRLRSINGRADFEVGDEMGVITEAPALGITVLDPTILED